VATLAASVFGNFLRNVVRRSATYWLRTKIPLWLQRSLGDIDAKYEVIDPTELPLSKAMHDSVSLAGTKRTNLSKQKTVDQIVDEDRKRLVQSAQGTRLVQQGNALVSIVLTLFLR